MRNADRRENLSESYKNSRNLKKFSFNEIFTLISRLLRILTKIIALKNFCYSFSLFRKEERRNNPGFILTVYAMQSA